MLRRPCYQTVDDLRINEPHVFSHTTPFEDGDLVQHVDSVRVISNPVQDAFTAGLTTFSANLVLRLVTRGLSHSFVAGKTTNDGFYFIAEYLSDGCVHLGKYSTEDDLNLELRLRSGLISADSGWCQVDFKRRLSRTVKSAIPCQKLLSLQYCNGKTFVQQVLVQLIDTPPHF